MNKPIATVARTNEILQRFDLNAKKTFGQNFIIEPRIVEKIAESSQCHDGAAIEIGPGIGALTEQLALRAKHVTCYEIDERLKDVLAYSLEEYENVEIIFEDFLNCDLKSKVTELKEKYGKVVIAANLPYYITTALLFKIFEAKVPLNAITVMMQKEVADRFTAKVSTKDYNALSIISSVYYDCVPVMKIPRTIFNPKPNVDSAVIQFKVKKTPLNIEDEQGFFEMVKACFKQRRKTIYNNYREYLKDSELAQAILNEAGIELSARAETCTMEDFIRLKGVQDEKKSIR
ncbi:MAG: 16S rRNA (adenine(1518)-N(6)/adenine(1519)-N(6))-dimethyltransferase RsmA [Erysipelotrichaceae bacterium]|nr:16S rRNA (adenine(1518)-N(6)/adenine(1519)-N(6))-dimethyltransferase RsmA [Erysipelotrichaceae bacterium]